jgi:hypothetical protein
MLLRSSIERSVAGADVTVSRLQKQVGAWFELRGSRDIASLLQAFSEQMTWKSAPRAPLLASIADLLSCHCIKHLFNSFHTLSINRITLETQFCGCVKTK